MDAVRSQARSVQRFFLTLMGGDGTDVLNMSESMERLYLVGYDCYFARGRSIEVEASSKEHSVAVAILKKRQDPNAAIEHGGIDWSSFKCIKKLQRK